MKTTADFGGNNLEGLTRRSFLGRAVTWGATAAIAGVTEHAWAAMAPPMPGAKANVPVLTVSNPSCFKILQVTDMHLGEWFVQPPIAALAAMVRNFKPDMIVNTGDCWVNVSRNGWGDTCQRMCRLFDGFKIPWAFAWGNHDESIDYNRAHAALEKSSHALYCGAADGNYRVAVKTKNDKTPLWNLLIVNDSRGGFQKEQIDWFQAESARIKQETLSPPPAFMFFHIPLRQYDTIAAPGKALGVMYEPVNHENGSADAFSAIRDSGFVKATFCGHDHVSDFAGTLEGVRLQYGRATGGYGKEKVRKGGTLITVDAVRKTFDVKSVLPDGSSETFNDFTKRV